MGCEWYLLRTKPSAEYLAEASLTDGGYEIFFPKVRCFQTRFGHTDAPLFPGYLFLRCNPGQDGWPLFKESDRIAWWVRFGGQIPSVPDEVVERLKDRLEEVNLDGGIWKRFEPGEKVEIITSSFNGVGEVVETPKSVEAPVKVMLNFMGRLIAAKVPWASIRELDTIATEAKRPPRRTRGKNRRIKGFNPVPAISV